MYRNELKFIINRRQKMVMANKLGSICQRDAFGDEDGGYCISSLYFDDYNQSAVFDKLSGVSDRKKYRVRIYNHQSDVIKLERKIKRNIVTEKKHVQISRDEYTSLIHGNVSFLRNQENPFANEFYLSYQTKNLRPTVVVEYRREAFIYKYGDVRITFDHFLQSGAIQKDLFIKRYMTPAMPQEQIILEVKYTGYLPDVIRNIIQIDNIQWQSLSKYVLCCGITL